MDIAELAYRKRLWYILKDIELARQKQAQGHINKLMRVFKTMQIYTKKKRLDEAKWFHPV